MNIIVRRKLKDYDAWKRMVSERNELRRTYGSRGVTVYRSARDSNEVVLVFEWDDQKSYMDYFNLPDVRQALEETGTTEITEVGESFRLSE